MKNGIVYLAVYFIIMFIPAKLFGQEDNSLKLVRLLNNGEYLMSRDLHQQICDTISPDIDLYYKFRMAQFLNKKDSSAVYLERIFKEFPDLFGEDTINAYNILFDIYISLRNNEGGLYTYKRMKQHLEENPYSITKDKLVELQKHTVIKLRQLNHIMRQPAIRIERKKTNDYVKILGALKPLIMARFNNINQKTILDTGSHFFCVMNKNMAELIGVKYYNSEKHNGMINGHIPTKKAIIDSIEIGNVSLYNIPIEVYDHNIRPPFSNSSNNDPEKEMTIDSLYTCITTPIIVGLPLMQLIGKILIDNVNKKITFPIDNDKTHLSKEPNLFIYNNDLYTHLKINEKRFTGLLDTGADIFIGIDTMFYQKHKRDIMIDTITAKLPFSYATFNQVINNISYIIPYNPTIKFEDKIIRLFRKRSVMIYPMPSISSTEYFDGAIGYHCFKRLGNKVLLDFNNMRLEVKNSAY